MIGFGPPASRAIAGTPVTVFAPALVAGVGSFSLTGKDVSLHATRQIGVAAGSFAFGAQAVSFGTGLPAAVASFALTGRATNLLATRKIYPIAGSFSLSGRAAILAMGHIIPVAPATFSLDGQSAQLILLSIVQANAGSFMLGANDVAIRATRFLYPLVAPFALSEHAVGFTWDTDITNGLYIRLDALQETNIELGATLINSSSLRVN